MPRQMLSSYRRRDTFKSSKEKEPAGHFKVNSKDKVFLGVATVRYILRCLLYYLDYLNK